MNDHEPDRAADARSPDRGMIRSEEELVIATELVETGRVRLSKRIETTTVTRTIELRQEILHIERIGPEARAGSADSTQPVAGTETPRFPTIQSGSLAPGSLEAGTVEIVLMQEEALISTQMVPRERIRLTKQIVTESRTIDADLAVEHVDLQERPPASPDHGRSGRELE